MIFHQSRVRAGDGSVTPGVTPCQAPARTRIRRNWLGLAWHPTPTAVCGQTPTGNIYPTMEWPYNMVYVPGPNLTQTDHTYVPVGLTSVG